MDNTKGWILVRREGKKYVAHTASASPAGTGFIPLFPTKRHALEYRDLRLQHPALIARRVTIT